MTSSARAQRLVDEFEIGATLDSGLGYSRPGFSIRHGIAAVLEHICATEDDISFDLLSDLSEALTAPTLVDRALAGDAAAAKQFLHEAGFTDQQGRWLPQFQPVAEDDVDLYLEQ
jgi:hypothetical protein